MSRNRGGDWIRSTEADEKLPWLEPVEEDYRDASLSRKKLFIGLAVSLAVIMAVVAIVSWLQKSDGLPAEGDATIIAAPEGDYKSPPVNPGGMAMEGEGDSVYAAGIGEDPTGTIDLTALPEEPIGRARMPVEAGDSVAAVALPPSTVAKAPVAPAKPAATAKPPAPAEVAIPKTAAPVKSETQKLTTRTVAPAAATAGGTRLQLGAFSSKAAADKAWGALTARFAALGGLAKSVEPVAASDGKTLYRLRASGAGAGDVCARLKVAGESCSVVTN